MRFRSFLACLLAVLMVFSLIPVGQALADSDWSSQYESFVINQEYLQSGLSFNSDAYTQPRFSLYDIDQNGVPELIAFNGGPSLAASTDYVFTSESWGVNYIGNVGYRGCELYHYEGSPFPGVFCSDGNNGVIRTTYYELRDGSITSQDLGESAANLDSPQRILSFYTFDEICNMGWNAFVQQTIGLLGTEDQSSASAYVQPAADDSWNPAYKHFVLDQVFLSPEYKFLKLSSNIEPRFSLYDLNADGVPELLVEGGISNQALQVHVFNFQNGQLHYSGSMPLKPYRYVGAPYHGLFCEYETWDGKRIYYYELTDGLLVSFPLRFTPTGEGESERSQQYTPDRDLYTWIENGQPRSIPFYSFSDIQVMGWQRFVLDLLWDSPNLTIGSVTAMSPEQQYAANIFLSNFSEQNRFQSRDFDVNDWNLDDIVFFAYLYCKINRHSAISTTQNDNGYFYTLSLDEANKVWERHFGFTLGDTEAAAFPLTPGSNPQYISYYDTGTFYFPAADGESYNRFTVVRQMEDIGDGSYRLIFDIYELDINEYWRANGVDSGFYYLSASAAQGNSYLSWKSSGITVVRPYMNNGNATYQLVKYTISKPLQPSPLLGSDTKTIHFNRDGQVEYECTFSENLFSEGASKPNNNLALFAGMLSLGVYHDPGVTTVGDIFSELGVYPNDIFDPTADVESRNKSFQYAIAEKELFIGGERTILLMVSLRGTLTDYEKTGDHYTKADSPILGYNAYGLVFKYASRVLNSVQSYVESHPELNSEKIKVLVTGHSLGGAGANLVGAMINDSIEKGGWYNVHDKEDVYVYTFGAIDSIDSHGTVNKGYENIHNITNYYDNFGPNGWIFFTAAGNSRYGKFGHIDLFFDDRDQGSLNPSDVKNHLMWTYLDAVVHSSIFYETPRYQKYARYHCPVDISVYKNSSLVAQVKDEVITYDVMNIPVIVIDGEKHFFLTDTDDYRFEITATDTGTMSCEFGDLSTGTDEKTFTDIKLEPGKTMCTELSYEGSTSETRMFVLNEKQQAVLEILEDGTEASLDNSKGSTYSTLIMDNHLDGTKAGSSESGASAIPEETTRWLIIAVAGLAVGIICLVILLTTRRKKPTKKRTTKGPSNHTQEKATLPAFSETRCCICGHRLDEKYGVFFRTKDGQEARIDADCYRQLYILRKSEDMQEIREARRYIRSRYDAVDPIMADQLQKFVKLADDYLSGN